MNTGAPVDDDAGERNKNLPGMGEVYNLVNLHMYHYAGNNPVKYTDPDGKFLELMMYLLGLSMKLLLRVHCLSLRN
jgi:hypothetical protein